MTQTSTALTLASALISRPDFEGCVLHPYLCSAGYWTIGIGNRFLADGTPVTKNTPNLTQDEAYALFQTTLTSYDKELMSFVTVAITDHQHAALLSWFYNVGAANARTSSLLRYLNAGQVLAAADQFLVWDKEHVNGKLVANSGLLHRRQIERQVFLTSDTVS